MYLLKISPSYLEGFLPYIPENLLGSLTDQRYTYLGCVSGGLACGAAVSESDASGKPSSAPFWLTRKSAAADTAPR